MITFFNFVEYYMEVFMDNFLVYGGTCESCLSNLKKVLRRCEAGLIPNPHHK